MQPLAKAAAVFATIAILVVLITPAPDELPGLPHKHPVSGAAILPQAQLFLSVSVATGVAGNEQPPKSSSADLLSLTCARLC
jgi:hypothetical protein